MQKLFRLLLAVVLIAVGAWGVRALFPSPQKVIRSRLLQLAKTASYESTDGSVLRGYKVLQLSEFLTPDVVIGLEVRGQGTVTLTGREQVEEVAKAALASGRRGGLKVELKDITVTLGSDRQTAEVNLTAKVAVDGQSDFMVSECNFSMKKVEGKWRVARVETVRTFSRLSRDALPQLAFPLHSHLLQHPAGRRIPHHVMGEKPVELQFLESRPA